MKLHSSAKLKEAFIVSVLVILAIAGSAVAYPPAQQPTQDYVIDLKPRPNPIELQAPALEVIKNMKQEPKVEERRGDNFIVTAYDLSVESCGKSTGHPDYGRTATGYSLAGQTWYSARTISVDPKVIPLGSKVQVKFLEEGFQKYDGVYTARDTGGGIRGHHVDFFIGDFGDNEPSEIASDFGVKHAEITIL